MVDTAKRLETGTPDCNFQGESYPKNVKEKKTSTCGTIIMDKKQEADLLTIKAKPSNLFLPEMRIILTTL